MPTAFLLANSSVLLKASKLTIFVTYDLNAGFDKYCHLKKRLDATISCKINFSRKESSIRYVLI